MTGGPDPVLHQRVAGTFTGPIAARGDQPSPTVIGIDWGAYDVPRMWSMVRHEPDPVAWRQAQGFEKLAQLLLSHHDSLKRLRNSLAEGWNPDTNEAAAAYFKVVDYLIAGMADDAVAHADTARGLDRILMALQTAKERIEPLKKQWDHVTTDLWPEWWDRAADDLNRQARAVMAETDASVGTSRRQITVATEYMPRYTVREPAVPESSTTSGGGAHAGTAQSSARPRHPVPPPMPGYDPVLTRGPDLQGVTNVPQPVPAVPGSPVSVLPVPPGSPYMPGGGAYVLPGPGIGRGGRIYPMPAIPTAGHTGQSARAPGGGGQAGQAGMVPFAAGTGSAPRTSDPRRPGSRDLVWQVAQGVPPVIGENPQQAEINREQLDEQDALFQEWFADLATPWDDSIRAELPPRQPGATS